MIDTLGKMMEKIICRRLVDHIGAISNNKYGFQREWSVVDAIPQVKILAEHATKGTSWKNGNKKYGAVITLDMKNAFNSASCAHIMQVVENLHYLGIAL